jgi:hypothetical protein
LSTVAPLFSLTAKASSLASGASFTGVTVTVTIAGSVPPLPSDTVYVNVTVPLKFGGGV